MSTGWPRCARRRGGGGRPGAGLGAAVVSMTALDAAGVTLRTDFDPLDAIWPDRPALPAEPVYEHAPPQATQPRSKAGRGARGDGAARRHAPLGLHGRRHRLAAQPARHDVSFNPVFRPTCARPAGGTLFIAEGKVDAELPRGCPPTASSSRPTHRPAPRWPHSARRSAGGRPQARHARPARRTRHPLAGGRGHQPEHAAEEPQECSRSALVREAMAEDGAAMCESYAGSKPRWRAATPHRDHLRRPARGRARAGAAASWA